MKHAKHVKREKQLNQPHDQVRTEAYEQREYYRSYMLILLDPSEWKQEDINICF